MNKEKKLIGVILAGGSGERFWPLSRQNRPKQFLALDGSGQSLIQATFRRLKPLCHEIFVVSNEVHRSLLLEHLPDLPEDKLIIEPVARDTAPAVLLAAQELEKRYGKNVLMGVFPSDHRICDDQAFNQTVKAACDLASASSSLVTLGIKPTYPATGYGYIEKGQLIGQFNDQSAHQAKRFIEKPDLDTAESLIISNRYLWNAGMFIWKVGSIQEEFKKYAPEIFGLQKDFEKIPKISVDKAVLEKSENVAVIPSDFGWDDLGDWNALSRLLQADNVVIGQHLGLDTSGAILYTTTGDDLIVTIGLEDVVIVRDGNVTLVARKDRTQDIKKIVQKLKKHPELEKYV